MLGWWAVCSWFVWVFRANSKNDSKAHEFQFDMQFRVLLAFITIHIIQNARYAT